MSNLDPLSLSVYQYKQRVRSLFKFQEAYEITNPEDKKDKYFFAKRDRFWFKKDVKLFYGENDHGAPFLTLIDNSIFDSFGSFTVLDPEGGILAHMRRKFWRSFFWRETWELFSGEGEMVGQAMAQGSFLKTFVRKFGVLRVIPIIGPILDMFMRLQYEYTNANGIPFAEFKRKASIRDFYRLNFLGTGAELPVDKRAIIGLSVLFDAAEKNR